MGAFNKIAFFNLKYHDIILWILWGFWAACFIVPHNHPMAFPLYAATGALWMRWIYFTRKLRKWGNASFGKMVIIFLLWAATGTFFGLIISRISLFVQVSVRELWSKTLYIASDPLLFNVIAITIISSTILGILIVFIQKRNTRIFRYLSIINIPLMILSIYAIAKKIINYNEDDLSIIIIQSIFLLICLALDWYNRRKEIVQGESSRAHYLIVTFEFVIYLQLILFTLLIK